MKELKQVNLKKKIIFGNILMLIILASVTGIKIFSNNKVEFIPIDEADERYQSMEIEKPEGAVVSDYFNDANKVLYISNYVCNHAGFYSSNYNGVALAKVAGINYKQKTIVDKVINNDEAFHQTLSLSSLVKVGEQRYITPNTYLLRKGKNVSELGATFDNNISAISKDKYLELYGSTPFGMTQYILRDEYIISSSYIGEKDGLYSFKYEFIPFDSTIKYARQVKTMAGASGLPEFDRANFVLTVDKDFYVQTIEYDEYYDLPLMGGLKITLTATETFVFSDKEIPVKERSEFEPFFNAIINDDEVSKKSGMTYLTDAFSPLLDGESINVLVNVTYDGKTYPIHASVDMKDLNIIASLPFNITCLYYDGYIYLELGNNTIQLSTSELFDVLGKYLPIDLTNISLDSLMESPLLADAMNNMTEDITENSCIIGMPLNENIDCKIILAIDEQDQASLNKINATIKIEDEEIGIDVSFEDQKYDYAPIENIALVTNLDEKINDLIDLFENQLFNVEIDAQYKDISLNGNVKAYVNYEDIINSYAEGVINVKYQDIDESIVLKYLNGEIAVSYKNLNIVLSIEDIMSLLDEFEVSLPEVPEIDVKEVVNVILEKLDFNKLIKYIVSNDELTIILSLISFIDFDNYITISVSDKIHIGVEGYGNIYISKANDFTVEMPTENVMGIDGINDLVEDITNLIDTPLFVATFDGYYEISDDMLLSYDGNVYFDINNLSLDALINLQLNDDSTEVSIKYLDNTIEICLFNQIIQFTTDEILSILEEVNNKFKLFDKDILVSINDILDGNLPEIDLMALVPTMISLLDSLNVSDESIKLDIDLDAFDLPLGIVSILFDIDKEDILVTSDYVNVTISPAEEHEISLSKNANINYELARKVLDLVYNILEDSKIYASFNYFYNDFLIDVTIYGDLFALDFYVEANINYQDLSVFVEMTIIDNVVRIKLEDNVIEISIEEALELFKELNDKFNFVDDDIISLLDNLMEGILPKVEVSDIIKLALPIINNLEINSNKLHLPIELDGVSIDASYDFNNDQANICVNDALILVEFVKYFNKFTLEGNTLTIDGIDKIVDFVTNIMDNLLFKADYAFTYSFNEKDKLDINGEIVFDIANFNAYVSANAIFGGITASVELVKVDNTIELKLGSIIVKVTIDDIYTLLMNLHTRYEILDIDTIDLIIDLLNGKLPEIDLDVIIGIIPTLLDNLVLNDDFVNVLINLDDFGLNLGETSINVDLNNELITVDHEMLDLNVSILNDYAFNLFQGNSFGYDQIDYCLDTVDAFIELIKNREFNLNVKGSVKNENVTTYDIDGSLYLRLSSEEVLSIESIEALKAHLLLIDQKMQHDIDLLLVDGIIYVTYTNYALSDTTRKTSKGTTKAFISFDKLMETLNYANQMFIKNDLIDSLVSSFGKTLDTSVLDTVIDESSLQIDLTDLIYNLTVSKTLLQVGINHDILNDYNPGGVATLQINNKITNGNVEIDKIYVNNFYSGINTVINLEADILNTDVDLSIPQTSGYINLDSIADLLVKLNNTIEIKNYDMSGTINLSISEVLDLANVPLTLKISLDGSNVKVYAKIEIPLDLKNALMLLAINDKTRTEIYYDSSESDMIYVKRSTYEKKLIFYTDNISKVEYKSQHVSDFLTDLVDNICYIFNFKDLIKNLITESSSSSETGESTGETSMYYADLVKNYTYGTKYDVKVNGKALTDGIIGDLTATIKEKTVGDDTYLYNVEASTNVFSILAANVKVQLNNFESSYSEQAFLQEMASYTVSNFTK